jgi:hypothetical protein
MRALEVSRVSLARGGLILGEVRGGALLLEVERGAHDDGEAL